MGTWRIQQGALLESQFKLYSQLCPNSAHDAFDLQPLLTKPSAAKCGAALYPIASGDTVYPPPGGQASNWGTAAYPPYLPQI